MLPRKSKNLSGLAWEGRILHTFLLSSELSVMHPPFKRVLPYLAGAGMPPNISKMYSIAPRCYNCVLTKHMAERERFTTVQTPLDQYKHFIDLSLGEKTDVPFTGGEIIHAETDAGEKVIVKKTAHNQQAEHEWLGLKIAHSTGISVPVPIALINYTSDHLAIVSTQIDGENLYYFPNQEIKNEIGRQVKVMHQMAGVDGRSWRSSERSTFVYYDRYIFNWSKGEIGELRAGSDSLQLLQSLSVAAEQFCKSTNPTFNHNDLHDGQIIVSKDGKPTIIDFGNWLEEAWLNEVGYHLFHLIRTDRAGTNDFANFLEGYLGGRKLSDTEKSNLAFYLVFISSRALSYFYKNNNPYLPTARETHGKVLKYLDDEKLWKSF